MKFIYFPFVFLSVLTHVFEPQFVGIESMMHADGRCHMASCADFICFKLRDSVNETHRLYFF